MRGHTENNHSLWITVLMFSVLSCEAQRISYIIGQNILNNWNMTSDFIVSIATEGKRVQSFDDIVLFENGSIPLPVRNNMYCETNRTSVICSCSLASYTNNININNDEQTFSTIWELSKDVRYKLKPINFTQDFVKMEVDESKCLHGPITSHIKFCLVDASIADVNLASNNKQYDNFTIINNDRAFYDRNPCELPRRQPMSYLCICRKSCHIHTAYNLTPGDNAPHLNITTDSRPIRGNIYVVLPRQYIGRPKSCEGKENPNSAGFLLDAASLKIVDFVLSVISLLTLFLTIFFFATCPELRNLHGKNLMSLSVTIFFSQILFLHDVGTLNDKLCSGIGALLHFCWLSIFVWTSSMAFDLARTFGIMSAMKQRQSTNDQRLYARYAFVAWGCPALVVLICVIVNSDLDNSMYGTVVDGGVCMASSYVMIYGLFLPFCISILFNIICFIMIVHGIETNKSKRSRSTQNLQKTRCFIYAKISTLLGLSWIVCLVATIKTSRKIWFTFSIMSNLQGVGIFVSFILLNRRVRGVVRRQLTSQNDMDDVVANVENAYESLQRDSASCVSEGIMQRSNLNGDTTDFNYENPICSPDEIE